MIYLIEFIQCALLLYIIYNQNKNKEDSNDLSNRYQFTARELEIIELLITEKSKTVEHLQRQLFVSKRTVRFHLRNIASKTNSSYSDLPQMVQNLKQLFGET